MTSMLQAERSVDYLKQQAKGPTAQAVSKLNSFKDSILGGRSKVSRLYLLYPFLALVASASTSQ